MVAETRLAERLGWIGADDDAAARSGCSTDSACRRRRRASTPTRLLAAMARDKKNRGGKIRFVLPRSIGRVELTDAAGEDDVRAVLATL